MKGEHPEFVTHCQRPLAEKTPDACASGVLDVFNQAAALFFF